MLIRFCTGNSIPDKIVRWGQRDGWPSHCEWKMPDGRLYGAHLFGGVRFRPAGYDKATNTRELIVNVPLMPAQYEKWAEFMFAQHLKPYDKWAVLGLGLGRNWRDPDQWFCSELVIAGLEHCGFLPRLASVVYHISPRDALMILSALIPISDAR